MAGNLKLAKQQVFDVLLSHRFHSAFVEAPLCGQVELAFAGVNVGVFGKGNLDQGGILLAKGEY
jgi:hypothetical protein